MNIVLIGCGRISKNHIKAIEKNNLKLIAICDSDELKLKTFLDEFNLVGKVKVYNNYLDLLKHESPEIISITTESGSHGEIALACIDKGIHLIIEKPITLDIDQADEIVKKAKEKNVKVATCMQNRFNLVVQETRSAIEKDHLGKLSHANINVLWNRNDDYYKQANWRGTWLHDGGALMNQSIHGIDLLCWMLGYEIDEVFGVLQNRFHNYFEAEDIGTAIVKFKNGCIGTIQGTTNVYPENLEETLLIFGENGTVKLGGKAVNKIEYWNVKDMTANEGIHEHIENVYGNGHSAVYADFVDAIKNNRSPYIDAKAGRDALEVVLAIYKSHLEGKPVKLPIKNFSTKDMIGVQKTWK